MHYLQHKFLNFSLRRQKKLHATPVGTNVRVSLMQAAVFYHHREAADRRDKVARLIQLALADLKEVAAIKELSQSLSKRGVDLNSHAEKHGGAFLL